MNQQQIQERGDDYALLIREAMKDHDIGPTYAKNNSFLQNSKEEDDLKQTMGQATRRIVNGTCPNCGVGVIKTGSSNRVVCSRCNAKWCWICKYKPGSNHFAFFNILGCPGLLRTPNYLPLVLTLNIMTSLLFPVVLISAPMIILLRYYPNQRLIQDQSERFSDQTRAIFHEKVSSAAVLIGIAGFTALIGVIVAPLLTIVGWGYQLIKICVVIYHSLPCLNQNRNKVATEQQEYIRQLSIGSTGEKDTRIKLQQQRWFLCCVRLPNTCPSCNSIVYKYQKSNSINCHVCSAQWCWFCRQTFPRGSAKLHFAIFNVFRCPGLLITPDSFALSLLVNLLIAFLLPLILLFAPLIELLRNYPQQQMIRDQVERFSGQTCNQIHKFVAYIVVLLGFSVIGLLAGILVAIFFGPFGAIYQTCKVVWLFGRAVISKKGIKDQEEDEFASPTPPGLPQELSPGGFPSPAINFQPIKSKTPDVAEKRQSEFSSHSSSGYEYYSEQEDESNSYLDQGSPDTLRSKGSFSALNQLNQIN